VANPDQMDKNGCDFWIQRPPITPKSVTNFKSPKILYTGAISFSCPINITCENYVSSLKMSNCKTLSELAHRNKSGTTNVADAALT